MPRLGRGRLGRLLESWFQPRPYRVHLDDVGTFVWTRIDGTRTVEEIAREMETEFGDRVKPVSQRLGLFLGRLERGRFINYRTE